jgi:hypothetical protein
MKVWILTSEHNDYNQHGEYFIAWFKTKPSEKELWRVLQEEEEDDFSLVEHILKNGGGRRKPYKSTNEVWYNLRQIKDNKELRYN